MAGMKASENLISLHIFEPVCKSICVHVYICIFLYSWATNSIYAYNALPLVLKHPFV